jgi:large subunit ribosomal protein L25
MSDSFTIEAQPRSDLGKGASRRLRRLQGQIPGIIYGSEKAPTAISVVLKDLVKQLENEAFYSHILTVNVGGASEQVVLKDLQRHPAKDVPTHVDFLRVDASHTIKLQIPLHFINEAQCIGVKTGGGIIDHQMTEVEVQCLPKDLPEYLEVDMSEVGLGEAVHLSQIKLPEGVKLTSLSQGEDHDHTVAMVTTTRGSSDASSSDDTQDGSTEGK